MSRRSREEARQQEKEAKSRRALKQRFIDWFHRLGEAYTKS